MSRSRIPNVNASLIHEARMLFQHFLSGRQANFYSAPFAESRAKKTALPICTHTVLKCSFCAGDPADAKFVINGYSTCAVHERKARSATNTPKFS